MFDVYSADAGDRVESLPDGRKGTFVDENYFTYRLSCGCCWGWGIRAEVLWDGETETDFVDVEDLRSIK